MQAVEQAEILEFLKQAMPVSQADEAATVIRTHISVVVLRGERAWKMKRAVRLPYADFSTVGLRYAACSEEVRLNRRTAPSLYLGVRRITREGDGRLAVDGDGTLVEAVVEMRRFDEDTLFSRLAASNRLERPMLTALARKLAAFHADAEICREKDGAGRIAGILELNEQCGDMAPVLGGEPVARLRSALRAGLERHRALLDERAAGGRIRRCHGDLHLRNICLVDGEPTPFDCIEFNEWLATTDVLYDLAFLLMDLWQMGRRTEANWVMNRYMDETGDAGGLPLLPYFMALRASIRAQVTCTGIRLSSGSTPQDELRAEARSYLDLALRLLRPASARLIAIGGLSGSGKSTTAAAIAPYLGPAPGARVLATDRIRKRLAGVPAESTLPPHTYTAESSARVYDTLYRLTAETLKLGYAVIADGVFANPDERSRIEKCAAEASAPFHGIWLSADPETLLARVNARRNDPSDATATVVRAQLERHSAPTEWNQVTAGGDADATARSVMNMLDAACGD